MISGHACVTLLGFMKAAINRYKTLKGLSTSVVYSVYIETIIVDEGKLQVFMWIRNINSTVYYPGNRHFFAKLNNF